MTVAGLLINRTNRIKAFAVAGWLLLPLGLGLLSLLTSTTKSVEWIFIIVPAGVGLGLLFSPLALATQAATEDPSRYSSQEELARVKGVAAGLNPFFRALGQALGIVICQSGFNNQMSRKLGEGAAQDLAQLAVIVKTLAIDSPERAAIIDAFVSSLRVVWWILIAITAIWLLPTLFLTKDTTTRAADDESVEHGVVDWSESSSLKSTTSEEIKEKKFGFSVAVDPVIEWGHRPSAVTVSGI